MFLHGIAQKPVKRGPMVPVTEGLITETGLEGNYYGGLRDFLRSKRQVTVISLEQWREATHEIDVELEWYMRRANLCVSGYAFGSADVGRILCFGPSAKLEVTGETEPCKRMDEIRSGLKSALTNWRAGVTCRVIEPGPVSVGDRFAVH